MLLYGNIGGIEFSYDQWTRLLEHKQLILNFMAGNVRKISIDLSTPHMDSLVISGRQAKSPMLYMYQVNMATKETSYVCIADPTVGHMFEMSDLFEYYFTCLIQNTNLINVFCKGVKENGQKIETCTHVNGIDYKLLFLELKHFPRGCVNAEKKNDATDGRCVDKKKLEGEEEPMVVN